MEDFGRKDQKDYNKEESRCGKQGLHGEITSYLQHMGGKKQECKKRFKKDEKRC